MEFYLGTGGYSNNDWLGLLYPQGTKPSEFLSTYAQNFNAVELNSSFYAIPGHKAFHGMVKKSQASVRFAIKIHQSMTHTRNAEDEMYTRLLTSVEPLRDVGMLGPFLAQFPYSFPRTQENRMYLRDLVTKFEGESLAVEFRHHSWDVPKVHQDFKRQGLTFVSVDYPALSGLPKSGLRLTSNIVYIRMHGRNKATWWEGKTAAERHDYLYSSQELSRWVLQLKESQEAQTKPSQVFFMMQNTTKGHALVNLGQIKEQLAEFELC